MKEDKLYGVRVFAGVGNAQMLDLRGAGTLYIEPNKYYYFENTPISFINRLVELRKINITYEITDNRRGCFRTVDMSNYEVRVARDVLKDIKGIYATKGSDKKAKAVEEEPEVVETIEFTPEEPKKVEVEDDAIIPEPLTDDEVLDVVETKDKVEFVDPVTDEVLKTIEKTDEATVEDETAEKTDEATTEDETVEGASEEHKIEIPSEAQLSKMSKQDLLNLATDLGVTEVSDINTKKEIRTAILNTIN